MKRIIAVLLCLLTAFTFPLFVSASSDKITLTKNFYIVYQDSSLKGAAEYMNRYVKEICGYSLKITDGASSQAGNIYLSCNLKDSDGYFIKTGTKNIYIKGSTLRNTVDGICRFLTEYGGLKYYICDEIYKTKRSISIPINEYYTYSPYFEMTDTDWYSPKDVDYSLFNGISGTEYRTFPKELGGGAEYISGFAHTMTNEFCSKDKYFKSDPDCFALLGVARTKESLCLSNPKTLEIVTGEVLDLLKEKHDPTAQLQIVSVTQNDNFFCCTCPRCLAKYAKYGSQSGLTVEFVNSIAKKVKEAGYNNVAIDTFAYMYSRSAPKRIVPDDNVIIRLCSIECCFSHPLNDKLCAANLGFAKDLKDWSKICDRLYVWDYTTNYSNYIGIFPNFNVLQENMQFFYENNVKGIYEEGNYSMTECDTEFGELRAYLIAKLMQNPYCDLEKEKAEFLNYYYGSGGKYIGEFIDIISESAATEHLSIYNSMIDTCNLTQKQIAKCDALWESAISEADGIQLERVQNSNLAWRYWKYKNNASEFKNILTRKEFKEQYDTEINETGVRIRESTEVKAFFIAVFQKIRLTLQDLVFPIIYLLNL